MWQRSLAHDDDAVVDGARVPASSAEFEPVDTLGDPDQRVSSLSYDLRPPTIGLQLQLLALGFRQPP